MIGIGHPKQAHFWKNIVKNLIENGHEIKILAIDKDVTLQLLSACEFDYEIYGKYQKRMVKKAYNMISRTYNALVVAKRFNPDILIAGTPYLAYVSKILRTPHIMLTDSEHAHLTHWLTYPFTNVIITPSCFKGKINPKKQVMYDGYEELSYLHPKHFTPDPSVLDDMGLAADDEFIIIRFVSWGASHDVGQHGIKNKKKVVEELEKHRQVFITSESPLSEELEKYRISIPPEKFHNLLYYATLYVGDGGATASEASVLGTPAVFVSTIVSGYLFDEEKYGLVHIFSDPETCESEGIKKALELLKDDNLKNNVQKRRKIMLNDKIDVTAFMSWFIGNYPESFKEMKEHSEKQYKFR